MAKYKSKYPSKKDIPEEIRPFYRSVNGQWEFNGDNFEGLAEDLNPGLAANRDKWKKEKMEGDDAIKEAQKEAKEAKEELAKLQKPGTKIITNDEAKQLEEYQALGTPADLKETVEKKDELEVEVNKTKEEKELKELAEEAEIDLDALLHLRGTYLDGLKVFNKKVQVQDPKNATKKIDKMVTYVEVATKVGDKTKVEDKSLEDYLAETKVPKFLVNALYEVKAEDKQDKSGANRVTNGNKTRSIKVPPLATGSSVNEGNVEEVTSVDRAKKFREETSTRVKPWTKKSD